MFTDTTQPPGGATQQREVGPDASEKLREAPTGSCPTSIVGVTVGVGVRIGVLEVEAPVDGVDVGVTDDDRVSDAVSDGVSVSDAVTLGVCVRDAVSLGVCDGVPDDVGENDAVALFVGVHDFVALRVGVLDGEVPMETDVVLVVVLDDDMVALGDLDGESEFEIDAD